MEPINHVPQERKVYDPPAVVYETELEAHAATSSGTGTGSVFDPLNLDKK